MKNKLLYVHSKSNYWAQILMNRLRYDVQYYNSIEELSINLQFSEFDIVILDASKNCNAFIEKLKKENPKMVIIGIGDESDSAFRNNNSYDKKILAERDDLVTKLKEIVINFEK